ncbi:MAG TPA: FeoB small GTPase domain-containing protein, partial [Anaerolineales bacterium]|nr:FeoB small GTPase domain-containing protein [Anaerolineales bacterium]
MRVALIGQPNCGKSTLFNQVAGYKAETGNFSGTTVNYTESRVRVMGEVIELVDLPGAYTLEGGSPAEMEAARYLRSQNVDVIINVADATHLAAALDLTLELLPLNKPVVLALNMMDEAKRLGLQIDGEGLARELGIPVLPLIASKGRGVKRLFLKSLESGKAKKITNHQSLDAENRHTQAKEIAGCYLSQGERVFSPRDRLDDILLHPIWGYAILLFVLYLFFQAVYGIGKLTEPPLIALFEILTNRALAPFLAGSLIADIVLGIMQGIAAGVAIVFPYLLPFLLGLGILEDVGYLPRIAFLMDALMHRLGLHGKAIVPFILGY